MLTPAQFYGGCVSDVLDGGETHYLLPQVRYNWIVPSGATADEVVLRLPSAYKLQTGGPVFEIILSGANRDVEVRDYDGEVVDVYDQNGVERSVIDVSDTGQWGTYPALRIFLAYNLTQAGIWLPMYWSTQ